MPKRIHKSFNRFLSEEVKPDFKYFLEGLDPKKRLIRNVEISDLDDALEELPSTNVQPKVEEEVKDDEDMEEQTPEEMKKGLMTSPLEDPSELRQKKAGAGVAGQTSRLIHASTVKGLIDEKGEGWDLEKLVKIITEKPKTLLSQNTKMKHSGGDKMNFFDLSLPAYHGLFFDEADNTFKLVRTCPAAGACKAFCYAAKGGYIQYPASSVKTGRNLNYLLNHPEDFKKQLIKEIQTLQRRSGKKNKALAVRWHDSGDFFNETYLDLAFEVAKETPDVTHYAYTKQVPMLRAKQAPDNFVFNFSMGGKYDKKVEAGDKQSIVITKEYFKDLDLNDASDIQTLKDRIAEKFEFPKDKIITYAEMMDTEPSTKPQYYVIVGKGAGDDAAMRRDVIGTLLLIH